MAYALESNQYSMIDRFGSFTHLVSGGNVQLPNEILRLETRINSIDRPASGSLGAIQLSDGNGNFIHDSDFEVSIDSTNSESSLTIGNTIPPTSKAYLLLKPYSGALFSASDGAIKCIDTGGVQSIQAHINGSWTPMTGTGGSVPGGANTEVQFNSFGNFAADPNFTFSAGTVSATNFTAMSTLTASIVTATTSLQLEETGGTDVITIQAPASLTLPYTLTLPVDDGNTNEFLQTNGSGVLAWTAAVTAPAGANTQIQYNDMGAFGADGNFIWTTMPQTLTIGTPGVSDGLTLVGSGSGISLADGSGGPGMGLIGGPNPAITLNRLAGGNVTINGIGDATFTGISGFLVSVDANNIGGSLVKSQLFQTFDPIITTGLQISSVIGGGGVNTITQLLDNHTTQGFSFVYPLGPNGGMQLKANNMQFMQAGSGGIGSGFQFIFDNDTLNLGDSVFRIVKGITGQTYSANSVFRCDGNGSLIWNGTVGNNITPQLDNTFTIGSNPSSAWSSLTVNNVNAGGAPAGTGIFANDLVLNGNTIMPSFGFVSTGEGIDIGELSGIGGPGVGGFRQVFAREFISGANGNASGSFLAHSSVGTSLASLSATGPDLNLSNSVQANSVILSSNSNIITGGTNPILTFIDSSVGTIHNMILYGNSTVTSGDRDKIFNIGYDSTLTNSPVGGGGGYQMQFTLGGASAGKLDIAGAGTFTGTLQGGTVTDGTAQITGGVGTGFTSITSTTLTDGAGATLNGGIVTGNTLTDSTLSIASGSITGGVNATFSGTVEGGTLTDGTATIMGAVGDNFTNFITDELNVTAMISVTNDVTNATGVSEFKSGASSIVYKRVSTFSHTFNSTAPYTIEIPDVLFNPDEGTFVLGGAAVKIKLTAMGLSTTGAVIAGLEYREYIVLFVPGGVSGGTNVASRHLSIHETQGVGAAAFVPLIQVTAPAFTNLSGAPGNIVVNNNMALGLEITPVAALVPPIISNNRIILRGTIEVV